MPRNPRQAGADGDDEAAAFAAGSDPAAQVKPPAAAPPPPAPPAAAQDDDEAAPAPKPPPGGAARPKTKAEIEAEKQERLRSQQLPTVAVDAAEQAAVWAAQTAAANAYKLRMLAQRHPEVAALVAERDELRKQLASGKT